MWSNPKDKSDIECLDCVVHPFGATPSGYHLASEDQVEDHKDWILKTLEKWAIAKFENGYVSVIGTISISLSFVHRFLDECRCKRWHEYG